MRRSRLLLLAAAVVLAAPAAARAGGSWSLTLGVWGGVSRYDVLGLDHAIANNVGAADGRDLLSGDFNTVGGMALFRVGWLDLGLLYEGSLLDTRADSEVFTPVLGVAIEATDTIRVDLLGELGGHRLANVGAGNDLASRTETVWLPSVGFRPGVSFRLPVAAARLVLSVTPFARWDLVKKQVVVDTTSGPGTRTYYEAGGTTYGIVGGVGIEL
jgi:hypothetical protein